MCHLSNNCTCSISIVKIKIIISIVIKTTRIITQKRRHTKVKWVILVPKLIVVIRINMKNILAMGWVS